MKEPNIIRVVKLSREDRRLKVETIDKFNDTLENLYEAIKCDVIDIQTRKIKGREIDFVIDDEYLLKAKTEDLPTAVFEGEGQELMFGNIILTGTGDKTGQLTSLNDLDIEAIKKAISLYRAQHEGKRPNYEPIFEALTYSI